MKFLNMKTPKIIFTVVALVLAGSEALIQLSGILDIPVYRADNTVGYIPAPSQSGAFLHAKQWQFNEHSMGAGAFAPDSLRFNMLLVGDSTVIGGNPLAQSERLGPQLEGLTGWQVWPVAAGSWALQNQLAYLRRHPDILHKVDAVAIVSNSGDFDEPSSWASSVTHPLKRPFPGLLYVARKYVFPAGPTPEVQAELQVMPRDWQADLHDFLRSYRKPVFFFLYPNLDELDNAEKMHSQLESKILALQKQSASNIRINRVATSPLWTANLYRDDIHPSAEGTAALAKIMVNGMCESIIRKMACSASNGTTYVQ